ncbi:unnamed protein product [Lupinus luteus]|uniref:Uncharacterized protein n=1 Tax=Lupinus luteus TaxID=3873 RepID=A0AAV1XDJ6_LUPLU
MHRFTSKLASSAIYSTSKNLIINGVISKRSYVTKDINFGVGARAATLQGVSKVAEAVKVTMGPKGRNVIIDKIHELVKQMAKATNTAAGDGTTCATVLTQAILTQGCKSVAASAFFLFWLKS